VERRVDLGDGTRLAYVEIGPVEGTPVVLLHGITDSWRSFERVFLHLPASLRVFAISQRGHGNSDKPPHGYTAHLMARDVARFMDAVDLDRAVIVGHSMGAGVAQRFAIDYPERVLGVLLEGAFLPRPGNVAVKEFWVEVSRLTDPVDPLFVRAFQQSTLTRPVPVSFFETVVGESLKVPAHVWRSALEPMLTTDFASELRRIRADTLIVWGDRDAFTPRADQDELATAIACSRLTVYEGTGHSPHWEEPERFAAQLVSFVRTLRVQETDRGGNNVAANQ
jgi:pimeloyl-ACP methyl ester carboxylesterase